MYDVYDNDVYITTCDFDEALTYVCIIDADGGVGKMYEK